MIKSKNKNINLSSNIDNKVDSSTLMVKCDCDTLIDVGGNDNKDTNK